MDAQRKSATEKEQNYLKTVWHKRSRFAASRDLLTAIVLLRNKLKLGSEMTHSEAAF